MRYRGRFAPSPTGSLHFGSLVAAVGSYLEATAQQGEWLVRIEDIDPPREVAGAADDILDTLEHYGFAWDGPVLRQSDRHDAYIAALEQLDTMVYPCHCSRKEIAAVAVTRNDSGLVYPGTCRPENRGKNDEERRPLRSLRLRCSGEFHFTDGIYGPQSIDLDTDCGDIVLRRVDGFFSYQLAVAVDDLYQGISHVVRGVDLLGSTPRQRYIMHCLGHETPHYSHLPLVVNEHGDKLSKQNLAQALPRDNVAGTLCAALQFLGQKPPAELAQCSPDDVWQWAKHHWQITHVEKQYIVINKLS